MEYETVIIWQSGEKEIHEYDNLTDAKRAEKGYRNAFGNQIAWTCTRTKSNFKKSDEIHIMNGAVIYCMDIPDMINIAHGLVKKGYSVHLHPKRLTVEIMEV